MTSTHVALLRGVNNIGMARRVEMAQLRALFEGLGFCDVRTVLNSGNVVFSVPGNRRSNLRARIDKALGERFGLTAPAAILSGAEVRGAVRNNPLTNIASDPSRLLVVVLRKPADRRRLEPLAKKRWAPEILAVGKRVVYLWCANGVGESSIWPAVDRALDRSGTARNLRTMTKLMLLTKS